MLIVTEGTETFAGSTFDAYARERAGVHRTTVARWRARGWPRLLVRLAALELGGHLGLIHSAWRGWILDPRTGALVAPVDLSSRPFMPEHLIAAPILHELRHELDRMRARQRDQVDAAALRDTLSSLTRRRVTR